MKSLSQMSLEELLNPEGQPCACGKRHRAGLKRLEVGSGALNSLPGILGDLGIQKPFIISDSNTRAAAWPILQPVLASAGLSFSEYMFTGSRVEPDEQALGSLVMAYDPHCDGILALGSGVINDLGKIFSKALGLPSVVVATAPSMDGYASDSASMIRDRVKTSLITACPLAVIADTRILKNAPLRLLQAGVGDMLAKYVSICEWRISHLVTGEYYCENVAGLVRSSLKRMMDAAEGLKNREDRAVEKVLEGLVLSGLAMAYAGVSRPASGLEHYFSHMWEMMALDRNQQAELHGIQVGVGTLLTLRIFEDLIQLHPSRETAEDFMRSFDTAQWEARVRRIFNQAADTILETAAKEGRNSPQAHALRLNNTLQHWEEIVQIAREELPPYKQVEGLMRSLGMPLCPRDIGISTRDTLDALHGAREIRLKYLATTLLWDLGLLYTYRGLERE